MAENNLKLPAYGGQALIEGVLMRGKHSLAAAYRTPEGDIQVHTEQLHGIYTSKLRSIPFIRGSILLWDSLGLGIRFLTLSANIQAGDDEKIEGSQLYGSLALSLTLAVFIFFIVPTLLSSLINRWLVLSGWQSNLVEGVIRLLFVITYIWAVGKMKEIARVYAYHGAEHKTINAYESGLPLTTEAVMKCQIEHPRCGTSFLLTLVIISILVFTLIGPLSLPVRIISRILLIPFIAGMAYEYTRFISSHIDNRLIQWLIKPNLALQKLTTREPEPPIVEVAIAAFKAMLSLENQQ